MTLLSIRIDFHIWNYSNCLLFLQTWHSKGNPPGRRQGKNKDTKSKGEVDVITVIEYSLIKHLKVIFLATTYLASNPRIANLTER